MFHDWDSFYLLIGSAAAALIGLLFVVATLTSGLERSRAAQGASVYMTPTVFHFAVVLLVSAIALAPGLGTSAIELILAACTLAGLLYAMVIARQIRTRKVPEPPHWSDFWCYGVAPAVSYLGLGATAVMVSTAPSDAPDGIGLVLLVLLLLGVRNAWDLVTFLAPRASKD